MNNNKLKIRYLLHVIQKTYNYVVHYERTQNECYALFNMEESTPRTYGDVTLRDYVGSFDAYKWSVQARNKLKLIREAKAQAKAQAQATLMPPDQWLLTTDKELVERLQELESYSTLAKKCNSYAPTEFELADDTQNAMEESPTQRIQPKRRRFRNDH